MKPIKKITGCHFSAVFTFVMICAFAFSPFVEALADPSIESKEGEAARIQAEIDSINQSAEQAVERYNQANVELEATTQRVVENEAALAEAAGRLVEAQERLNKRVENIYREGSLGFIDVLLNTSNFDEFLTKYDMLGRIGSQDKADVEEVLRYKEEVENAQAQLEESQQKQQELVDALQMEKNDIESRLTERQAVLNGLEADIAEIMARQAEERQAVAASLGGTDSVTGSTSPAPSPSPTPPPETTPPPSNGGVVSIAMQYLGVPYVWGGASPSGFDCSGLVMYVYAQVGIYLPHSAAAQYYAGTPISQSELAPGDLVFFGSPISHVGIYIGGGGMIHAPFEGSVVSICSIWAVGGYSGAARL